MSIFSKLKLSKKAAKEHKQKLSQQITSDDIPKVPYKHVPRHAAVDALTGAPSSWKHEDRPKILEHHKRRSMMATSRTGSALSIRTDSASHTPPVPSLLRNSSYSSYNPTWNDRGDYSYLNEPYQKRKRVSRNHSFIDSGIGPSPLASSAASKRADVSPTSSSNSSLTDENLEIPPLKRSQPRSSGQVFAQKDIFEQLNKNGTRKLGEAPISTSPTSSSPGTTPSAAPVELAIPKVEKQKRRWTFKGKGREVSVAA